MIQLKNTTDKQTFHIPRTVMKTEFASGTEVKDVSITENGTYKIIPSKGKKSLSAVNLDVNVVTDPTPYYNEGFEDGVEEQKSKLESIDITENGTYNKEDGYNRVNVEVHPVLQTKDIECSINGDYSIVPDEGYDGLGEVNVSVNFDTSNIPFVVPSNVKFAWSGATEFPESWDWSEWANNTDCRYLFYNCQNLTKVPTLTLKPKDFNYAFAYTFGIKSIDASKWDTTNLTNCSSMFSGSTLSEQPIFDTSNVTDFREMYAGTAIKTATLNTPKAKYLGNLFRGCSDVHTVSELDASSVTSNMYSSDDPFTQCNALRNFGGFKGLKVSIYIDDCYSLSYESAMNVINKLQPGVSGKTLYLAKDVVNLLSDDDIAIATNKGWSVSPTRSITSPITVTSLSQISSSTYQITPKTYDVSQYSDLWYSGAYSAIPSTVSVFEGDLSATTNAMQMFKGRTNLRYVTLKNTSNITNMNSMFSGCVNLLEVDTTGWDTSNVTEMKGLFEDTGVVSADLSNLDVSKAYNLDEMFYKTKIKTVDMSTWKHNGNVRMKNMFANSYVEEIIFGDTTGVYMMDGIFSGAKALKSITMTYPVTGLLSNYSMFYNVTTEGTFYYNPEYDYSSIINQLPATWKAVPLS